MLEIVFVLFDSLLFLIRVGGTSFETVEADGASVGLIRVMVQPQFVVFVFLTEWVVGVDDSAIAVLVEGGRVTSSR